MAVFTALTRDEIAALLSAYQAGDLLDFEGIPAGIENTNYFVSTDRGRYVLTVFERLLADQVPFYLGLMKNLAQRGLPVPEPAISAGGTLYIVTHGKPAALVTRLPGRAVL